MVIILEVDINGDHNNNSVYPAGIQNRQAVQQYPDDSPTNYIYEDTGAATEDLFDKRPLNDLIASWDSITLRARVYRANDANACQARLMIEDPTGGGPDFGNPEALSTTSTLISYTWSINPDTGLPWTRSQLNAFEIGIELTGNAATEARCTQLWAEVDFTTLCDIHSINDNPSPLSILEDVNISLPAPIVNYHPQNAHTIQLQYPDGSTGSINNAHLVDGTRYIASIPLGGFPSAGKYRAYARQQDSEDNYIIGRTFPFWVNAEFA